MCCNSQRFLITVNVWYFTLVNHVLYTTVHDKLELTGAQWDTGLHRYSLLLAPLPPPLWRLILSLN